MVFVAGVGFVLGREERPQVGERKFARLGRHPLGDVRRGRNHTARKVGAGDRDRRITFLHALVRRNRIGQLPGAEFDIGDKARNGRIGIGDFDLHLRKQRPEVGREGHGASAALDGDHVVGERDAALVGALRHGERVAEDIAVGILDRESDRCRAGFSRGVGGRGEGDQPPAGQRDFGLARLRVVGMVDDIGNPRVALRGIGHRGHDIAEKFVGQVSFESRRALVGAVGEGEVLRKEDQFGGGDSRLLNHGDGLFKPRAAQHDPDRTGQSGVVGVIEADGRDAAAGRAVERRPRRLGGELSGPRPRAVDRDGEFAGLGRDRIPVRIDGQVVTLLEGVGARDREESRQRQYQVVDSFHRFWFL